MRCLLLLLALPCLAQAQKPGRLPDYEHEAYLILHPPVGGLKWKKTPWITDLAEGVAIAKKEKRPLFLWVAGDPPLERC